MGDQNFRKVDDKRSSRPSRTDPYIAWQLRGVSRQPVQLVTPPELFGAPVKRVLAELDGARRAAEHILGREVPLFVRPYQFGELVGELVGCPSAHLARSGLYLMHANHGTEDLLYAGASGSAPARHRLTCHVASGGTKTAMGEHVARLYEMWAEQWRATGACEPSQEAILHAMFGANRWIRDLRSDDPEDYRAAAGLIARGAFDVILVEVAPGDKLIAHLLEQFVCAVVQALTGRMPALNRRKIYPVEGYAPGGRKRRAGAIAVDEYRKLRSALTDLAAGVQVDLKRPSVLQPGEAFTAMPSHRQVTLPHPL
jgi:hypothetical protein